MKWKWLKACFLPISAHHGSGKRRAAVVTTPPAANTAAAGRVPPAVAHAAEPVLLATGRAAAALPAMAAPTVIAPSAMPTVALLVAPAAAVAPAIAAPTAAAVPEAPAATEPAETKPTMAVPVAAAGPTTATTSPALASSALPAEVKAKRMGQKGCSVRTRGVRRSETSGAGKAAPAAAPAPEADAGQLGWPLGLMPTLARQGSEQKDAFERLTNLGHQLQSTVSLLVEAAEASLKKSQVDGRLEEIEARERKFDEAKMHFHTECNAREMQLKEMERKLQVDHNALLDLQRSLNAQEEEFREKDRILKLIEGELEAIWELLNEKMQVAEVKLAEASRKESQADQKLAATEALERTFKEETLRLEAEWEVREKLLRKLEGRVHEWERELQKSLDAPERKCTEKLRCEEEKQNEELPGKTSPETRRASVQHSRQLGSQPDMEGEFQEKMNELSSEEELHSQDGGDSKFSADHEPANQSSEFIQFFEKFISGACCDETFSGDEADDEASDRSVEPNVPYEVARESGPVRRASSRSRCSFRRIAIRNAAAAVQAAHEEAKAVKAGSKKEIIGHCGHDEEEISMAGQPVATRRVSDSLQNSTSHVEKRESQTRCIRTVHEDDDAAEEAKEAKLGRRCLCLGS